MASGNIWARFLLLLLVVVGSGCTLFQLQKDIWPDYDFRSAEFDQLGVKRTFITERFGPPQVSIRDPKNQWIDVYLQERQGLSEELYTPQYKVAVMWFYDQQDHVQTVVRSFSKSEYHRIEQVVRCAKKQNITSAYSHCSALVNVAMQNAGRNERISRQISAP